MNHQAMRWPADALHALATLRLDFNRIGPAGIHALSRAFASGGAAQLQLLYLQASYTKDTRRMAARMRAVSGQIARRH